jgi:hypothetical protein
MVLWTTSTSSRLGGIDWALPIGSTRKLIGEGHYHGRLSLDTSPGIKALDDHQKSQTWRERTLTAVSNNAGEDNGVVHSTDTVLSTSTPYRCQLADRVRAKVWGNPI